jgi:hypothetical protein
MLKAAGFFFTLVAVVWFNATLTANHEGVLVRERISADGWSRECVYYKPVKLVTVNRPIHQLACPRYFGV